MKKYIIGKRDENGMPIDLITGSYGEGSEDDIFGGKPWWQTVNFIKMAKFYDSIEEIKAEGFNALDGFWTKNRIFEIREVDNDGEG